MKDGYLNICKECKRKYSKKYYEEHKEEKIKYQRDYYKENKEECNERTKKYHEEHREHLLECQKVYNKEHKEERKEYDKKYKEEHKEHIQEYQKKYYEEHKEEKIKYQRDYYKENKEDILENTKSYRINNPEKAFNQHSRRRQKEENQGNGVNKIQWKEMMEFFDWKCAYSGEYIGGDNKDRKRTIDHIVALDNGGEHEIWNCVPCYASYNYSKHDKNMLDWYLQQEYFDIDRLTKIYEWRIYAYWKWENNY